MGLREGPGCVRLVRDAEGPPEVTLHEGQSSPSPESRLQQAHKVPGQGEVRTGENKQSNETSHAERGSSNSILGQARQSEVPQESGKGMKVQLQKGRAGGAERPCGLTPIFLGILARGKTTGTKEG